MKTTLLAIMAAALLAIASAGPAFAQVRQYDADFNNYLNHHPNEAAQLRSNPGLIDNPSYIHNHPGLNTYLTNHPNVRRTIRGQTNGAIGAPYAARGYGDYDEHHVWRSSDWWQTNNPGWWRQHHPEWAANHPHWYPDGDYDDHHVWRDSGWWQKNHPQDWSQWHHNNGVGHGHDNGVDHGHDNGHHGPDNGVGHDGHHGPDNGQHGHDNDHH